MPDLSLLRTNESIRVFPDGNNIGIKPEIRHGSLQNLKPWYNSQNRAGGGVFYSVNITDGIGAKEKNIVRVRTFYTDIDGIPTRAEKDDKLLELMEATLPPSAIVSTRNGFHAYWYTKALEPNTLKGYSITNLGLANKFGGDKSVRDIARVLRLPGTLHMKNPDDPYKIKVIHDLGRRFTYTEKQIRAAYPPPRKALRPLRPEAKRMVDKPEIWGIITEDLELWNPTPGQRNMAMMLAAGVAIKFGVGKEDCFHDLLPIVETWGLKRNEFNELRRVTNWAYDRGNPASVAALRNLGIPIRTLPRPRMVR